MNNEQITLVLASALVGALASSARLTLTQSALVGIVAGVLIHSINRYFLTEK